MLESLHIENIALITKCDITFDGGLNILSGETGAGKSIVIDAISFVLGARADKGLIRFGEKAAKVSATFGGAMRYAPLFEEMGITAEDTLLLSRTMTQEGKGDIRVNGNIVTVSMLRKLTAKLLDMVGQHDGQYLLKSVYHIDLVDSFGGAEISAFKGDVSRLFAEYSDINKQLSGFGDAAARERRIDVLAYQIKEIEAADLQQGEEEELLERRKIMNSTEKIVTAINTAKDALLDADYGSAVAQTSVAFDAVSSISDIDAALTECAQRLENAKIELKDIAYTVASLSDSYEFSPYEREKLEQRLDLIRTLKRKYGGSVDAVLDFYASASTELDSLSNAEEALAALNDKRVTVLMKLYNASAKLSKLRRKLADKLAGLISAELEELAMKGTTFAVDFSPLPTDTDSAPYSANGFDKVEFLLSANAGAPLMPLSKIASGGEMSRIMLALKVILCKLDGIQTVIFDEIDTGISGFTAQTVACKLYKVAKDRQVIAVTHLPQLAAMADRHFVIEKDVMEGTTTTEIIPLPSELRAQEVARLIGGSNITESALPHAQNLISWSDNYKAQ